MTPSRFFSDLTLGICKEILCIWTTLNSFCWILGSKIDKIHQVCVWTNQSITSAYKHCPRVKQCFQDWFDIIIQLYDDKTLKLMYLWSVRIWHAPP